VYNECVCIYLPPHIHIRRIPEKFLVQVSFVLYSITDE